MMKPCSLILAGVVCSKEISLSVERTWSCACRVLRRMKLSGVSVYRFSTRDFAWERRGRNFSLSMESFIL